MDSVTGTAAQVRSLGRRPANLPRANADISPRNGKLPRREATLPVHRSILALDIENSTRRTNPVKEELRQQVYRLVMESLAAAGIDDHYCDPFTDRGDGVLVLLHPADDVPKPYLLSRLMPALASRLDDYNSGISPDERPRLLRLRAVIHAGEVHFDGKGFFGEDLAQGSSPRRNGAVGPRRVRRHLLVRHPSRLRRNRRRRIPPAGDREGRRQTPEGLGASSARAQIPLGNTASSTGLLGAVGLRAAADVYMSLPTIRFKPSGLVIVMRRWPVRMKPRPRQLLNARVTVARDVPARPASSS